MKRSTQVSMVLMTVAGIGASAYALGPNRDCRQSEPNAPGDAPRDCRSSHGGGHGSYFFGSSGSGSSGTSSAAEATSRGGFGGTGHGISGGE